MSNSKKYSPNKAASILPEHIEQMKAIIRERSKQPKFNFTMIDIVAALRDDIEHAIIQQRYSWEDVATWLNELEHLEFSATTLHRYYKKVVEDSGEEGASELLASIPAPARSKEKKDKKSKDGDAEPAPVVNPSATRPDKGGKTSGTEVQNYEPVIGKADESLDAAPTRESVAPPVESTTTAKADTNPEPKKKLTALERLALMGDDEYDAYDDDDDDDDEAAAEPELVIRGNFSIMPKDEDL